MNAPTPDTAPTTGTGAGTDTGAGSGRVRVSAGPLDPDSHRRFTAARLLAVDSAPYLAHALFAVVPVTAHGLGTFAVDASWRLYLDPAQLVEWSPAEAGGALVHEVGHLVRDHAGRARDLGASVSGVDHERWNYATDAAINDDLVRGHITLPEGAVTPAGLGLPANGIEEAYYAALATSPLCQPPPADGAPGTPGPDTAPGGGSDGESSGESGGKVDVGCGSGAGDPAAPWELPVTDPAAPAVNPGQARVVRRQVAEQVRAAAATAPGTVPGSLDRWADRELAAPVVPWQRVLGSAVRRAVAWRAGAADYTYSRPARRRLPGVVSPALRAPRVTVAVVLDTSASIGEASLSAALSEVGGVVRAAGIDAAGLPVLSVDSRVATTSRVRRGSDVPVTGGGGTDMRVGITAALALRPRPDVVVVLTDGWTPWPDRAPAARVVIGLLGPHAADPESVPAWATAVPIPAD